MKIHKAILLLLIIFFFVVGLSGQFGKEKGVATIFNQNHPEQIIATPTTIPEPNLIADQEKEYILGSYFYTKDLGIKFKISNELIAQKLISRYRYDNDYGLNIRYLDFSTEFLSNATSNCALGVGALGSIIRKSGMYRHEASSVLVKQFKDFNITYTNGGYDCTWESESEIVSAHNKAWKDLESSLKTMQEI